MNEMELVELGRASEETREDIQQTELDDVQGKDFGG